MKEVATLILHRTRGILFVRKFCFVNVFSNRIILLPPRSKIELSQYFGSIEMKIIQRLLHFTIGFIKI